MKQTDVSATAHWLNHTTLGVGLTSLLSDWSHEMATAILPAFLTSLCAGPGWLGIIEGNLRRPVKCEQAGRWPTGAVHHCHGHAQPSLGFSGRSFPDSQTQNLYRTCSVSRGRTGISFARPADFQSLLSGHLHSPQP